RAAAVVVVDHTGAGAPLIGPAANPGCRGDVDEAAAAVLEQMIAADGGDEQVDPSVIVVVGGSRAHTVDIGDKTGGRRDVRESSAALVAIEHESRTSGRARVRLPQPRPR